jgi:hypothetical protein
MLRRSASHASSCVNERAFDTSYTKTAPCAPR